MSGLEILTKSWKDSNGEEEQVFILRHELLLLDCLDPETSGIMAWNKVFVIEPIPGQPQAVLLLDTQGAFDLDSDVKDITLIFALSTMLSR